jgi:hypothetical protein
MKNSVGVVLYIIDVLFALCLALDYRIGLGVLAAATRELEPLSLFWTSS